MSHESVDLLQAQARRIESDMEVMQSHLDDINSYPKDGVYGVVIGDKAMRFQIDGYSIFLSSQLNVLRHNLFSVRRKIGTAEQLGLCKCAT